MRAILLLLIALGGTASARDLCAPGVRHRGAVVSLDVKDADARDVMRLVADIAHANLVVADTVAAKVTVKLHAVPWDAAVCAIAATYQLRVDFTDTILTVTSASQR